MNEHDHERLMAIAERHRKDPDFLLPMFRDLLKDRQRALDKNADLRATLEAAKDRAVALREEVDKLSAPPLSFGMFLQRNDDGTVVIMSGGRKLKVNVRPELDIKSFQPGQELILNDALNVVEAADFERQGLRTPISQILDDGRIVIVSHADEERVVRRAGPLQDALLRVGDIVLVDARSEFALECLPKSEVDELLLEVVPDISYSDIGGLAHQIEQIQDAIELPYAYADYFREHKLVPPKGVLLYGPPGCGKTLIAKAVANSLASRIREKTGKDVRAYFLNVKGPELLNKYVGETERKIREIFQRAREKADAGCPVVVFFDEMESLFRTRGSGISSDIESTIVPQFLAELDGVEGLSNVIVIGASNRQDLIDPAVLRPGRFDVKIKVERPNKEGAADIFSKYLTPELPLAEETLRAYAHDPAQTVAAMIQKGVEWMYGVGEEHRFIEVTYASGGKETLYFRDFVSGALIEGVVIRAKKHAVKRYIETMRKGIAEGDLVAAVREEFAANEDLPNTTNPDDWAKIAGRRGERIVNVRPLVGLAREKERKVETTKPGHYL